MVDLMSVAVGLICGGGVGFIAGRLSLSGEIRALQDTVFILDKTAEAARGKLRVLTERDELGRFTGGKK